MDTATSDIRAVEFTQSCDGNSPILPDLLNQIPENEEIATVTADGAYDTRRCHTAICLLLQFEDVRREDITRTSIYQSPDHSGTSVTKYFNDEILIKSTTQTFLTIAFPDLN